MTRLDEILRCDYVSSDIFCFLKKQFCQKILLCFDLIVAPGREKLDVLIMA